ILAQLSSCRSRLDAGQVYSSFGKDLQDGKEGPCFVFERKQHGTLVALIVTSSPRQHHKPRGIRRMIHNIFLNYIQMVKVCAEPVRYDSSSILSLIREHFRCTGRVIKGSRFQTVPLNKPATLSKGLGVR